MNKLKSSGTMNMWRKTEKWSWWCLLCGDMYGFVIEKRMDETEEGEKTHANIFSPLVLSQQTDVMNIYRDITK